MEDSGIGHVTVEGLKENRDVFLLGHSQADLPIALRRFPACKVIDKQLYFKQ